MTSPNDKTNTSTASGRGTTSSGGPSYFASDPTELGLSVSAMVWREGALLLMRRSDNGFWGLPGGFVEVGESVEQATRREVAEETGWEVEVGALIGVYSDPATQVVDYGPSKSGPSKSGPLKSGPSKSGKQEGVGSDGGDRRIQVVNLCFHATASKQGEPTTPEETLEMGFFETQALPEPFVPIHTIRIEDGLKKRPGAAIR